MYERTGEVSANGSKKCPILFFLYLIDNKIITYHSNWANLWWMMKMEREDPF